MACGACGDADDRALLHTGAARRSGRPENRGAAVRRRPGLLSDTSAQECRRRALASRTTPLIAESRPRRSANRRRLRTSFQSLVYQSYDRRYDGRGPEERPRAGDGASEEAGRRAGRQRSAADRGSEKRDRGSAQDLWRKAGAGGDPVQVEAGRRVRARSAADAPGQLPARRRATYPRTRPEDREAPIGLVAWWPSGLVA